MCVCVCDIVPKEVDVKVLKEKAPPFCKGCPVFVWTSCVRFITFCNITSTVGVRKDNSIKPDSIDTEEQGTGDVLGCKRGAATV